MGSEFTGKSRLSFPDPRQRSASVSVDGEKADAVDRAKNAVPSGRVPP